MSDQIIARVSQSLAKEQSLESLVRQLLEMLEMVTDMESTYLTKVDVEARLQHIWICPYISRHLLSLNPLLACCRRYSRGER
ncbi:hypothetical protein ECZU26_44180 [Escherichia coli]|nr:hypothetical protein ECZU26_44180 [Escherichia coli]